MLFHCKAHCCELYAIITNMSVKHIDYIIRYVIPSDTLSGALTVFIRNLVIPESLQFDAVQHDYEISNSRSKEE